jgi:hypothetical protein
VLNAAKLKERKDRGPRFAEKEINGEKYRCRILKLSERDAFQLDVLNDKGGVDKNKLVGTKARLLALCLVDEDGNSIGNSRDFEEAFDPSEIDAIDEFCKESNGMNAKAVEEAAGNS